MRQIVRSSRHFVNLQTLRIGNPGTFVLPSLAKLLQKASSRRPVSCLAILEHSLSRLQGLCLNSKT